MSTSLVTQQDPYQTIRDLQKEIFNKNRLLNELEEALHEAREETAGCRREATSAARGVLELRKVLTPLYQGLRHIFGELDAINPEAGSIAPGADPRKQAIWDSWKAKLPSGEGKAIDALLLHGSMTTAQLRIHIGCASRTAQNIVQALKSKGLIVKNGASISLKEL